MARSLEELAAPLRDVSRWNRLLNLPSDRRSGYLSFAAPARAVRDALSRGGRVVFSEAVLALRDDWSSAEPVPLGADEAGRRMERLVALAGDIDEETSVSPLMLGLGLLLWHDEAAEAQSNGPTAITPAERQRRREARLREASDIPPVGVDQRSV
ncbi:DUF4011 domain-containing protein [Methylorubrum sp. POS3]|uniref:DUF4011 domain-containing protein n=1 Tax=Methylorubrum sp. POS3 TaxID=2998492 RepID=UPI00372648C4